jgi:hypothetical protein
MAALTGLLLAKDPVNSEAAMRDCYRTAVAAGLIRGSLIIAIHLAMYYRLGGRSADALALLAPLVSTARIAGTGWVQAEVFGQLVHASLDAGSLGAASAYTVELAACASANPLTQALVNMSRARVCLAHEEFAPALETAAAAETAYAHVGMARYIGLSRHLQAEALCGLGERERARSTIARAIDVLNETAHPYQLAQAYRLLARITGRPTYARTARRLMAH